MKAIVDFPDDFIGAKIWSEMVSSGFRSVYTFEEMARLFLNRDIYLTKDRSGNLLGDSVVKNLLFSGSQEEADNGMIFGSKPEKIKHYSQSVYLRDTFYFPDKYETRCGNTTVKVSPYCPAWRLLKSKLHIGLCSHAYITGGNGPGSSEFFSSFYPISFGERTGYILFIMGGRYGETYMSFFQGDPDVWAEDYKRDPRNDEIDKFFNDRDAWHADVIPTKLPIDIVGLQSDVRGPDREWEIIEVKEVASYLLYNFKSLNHPYLSL